MKGNFELSKGSRRSISSGAGRAASRFPISHAKKKKVSDYENHFFMWLLLAATYHYQKTEATSYAKSRINGPAHMLAMSFRFVQTYKIPTTKLTSL